MASWWASKVRQFRTHLRARVTPEERAALATWTTAPQLALFDSMHVADRRHGLDVVASLRADGVDRTGRPAGRPAPRRRQGRHRRLAAGRLVAREAYGAWVWRARVSCPASAPRSSASATHAETSARLAAAAGCSRADGRPDPLPGRRRATPSSGSCCASRTRRTDDGRAGHRGRAQCAHSGRAVGPRPRPRSRLRRVRGAPGAAPLAHRGPQARRADRAAGRTRRCVPRRARLARRRTGWATSARSWPWPAS